MQQEAAPATDVQSLYGHLAQAAGNYREIHRQRAAEEACRRWALLQEIASRPAREPAAPVAGR